MSLTRQEVRAELKIRKHHTSYDPGSEMKHTVRLVAPHVDFLNGTTPMATGDTIGYGQTRLEAAENALLRLSGHKTQGSSSQARLLVPKK